MNFKDSLKDYVYPLLAITTTLSLVSIAASLVPIAKWNAIQNDCISRVTAEGYDYVDKVWACNGGGN